MFNKDSQSLFACSRSLQPFLIMVVLVMVVLSGLEIFFARKDNVSAAPDIPVDVAAGLFHADPASTIPACVGQSECFAFTVDTRLDEVGELTNTDTSFAIPISNANAYNWVIDWGDESSIQAASGTGASSSAGVSHTYLDPGQYRITIRPNSAPANGWFRTFGFGTNDNGANSADNKSKFRAINTPFTTMMRRNPSSLNSWNSSFARIFYGAKNGLSIPAGLFDSVDTSGGSDFGSIFNSTFSSYAYNSTTATIPAGLFNSMDTSKGTNFNAMFSSTFSYYAQKSTAGTIPAGLFDALDTANGTDFSGMFSSTFYTYAQNSTTATIPAGLFDSLNTANGVNFSGMFQNTFGAYAQNSTTATIPAGLFDSLNTANGVNFSGMFQNAFGFYAQNSTTATIPTSLFGSIDTTKGTNFDAMFVSAFNYYATRQYAFVNPNNGSALSTGSFTNLYSTKITPTGTPSSNPAVTPGTKAYPTYNTTARNITAPTGSYTWYRTDGTSCSATNPTPDCGEQTPDTLVTFPNNTEWTPETSTEKGKVTFYSQRIITDIDISSTTIEDTTQPGTNIATFSPTTSLVETDFTYTLVPHEGNSYDNDSFTISGSNLILNTTPNYTTKPNYTIYIQVADSEGNILHKHFNLTVSHTATPPTPTPGVPETPTPLPEDSSTPSNLNSTDITAPSTGYFQIDSQEINATIVFVVMIVAGTGSAMVVKNRRQKLAVATATRKQSRK